MNFVLFSYSIGFRLTLWVARFISLFQPKLARMFKARRTLLERVAAFRDAIPGDLWWFHVASAGEMEQAVPLMEQVRTRHPEAVLFVSFFSPSAERAAVAEKKRREQSGSSLPWDYADYLCWDTPMQTRAFVHTLAPKCFISLHAELWPRLFSELQKRQIPIQIGAVFLPEIKKMSWFKRWYWKQGLSPISKIATVDDSTQEYLQKLFPEKNVELLGDPRIDRVLERAERNFKVNPQLKRERPDTADIVLASIHHEDWEAIQPWLGILSEPENFPHKLWIVPHEPEEAFLKEIERDLAMKGIPCSRHSIASGEEPVILVDRVGFLAELYARSSIAYVGGSYSGAVHNVLEPAAYGVAIVTGPDIYRSCEAVEMKTAGALAQADCDQTLQIHLQSLVANELYREQLGAKSRRYLIDRQGVAARYGNWLLDS